jgi:hypothetical protein
VVAVRIVSITQEGNFVKNVKVPVFVNTEIENIDAKFAEDHLYANMEKKKIIANNVAALVFVNMVNINDTVLNAMVLKFANIIKEETFV